MSPQFPISANHEAPLLQECTNSFGYSILKYYSDYYSNNNTITFRKNIGYNRSSKNERFPDSNPHKTFQTNSRGESNHKGYDLGEDNEEETEVQLSSPGNIEEYVYEALQYQKKYNTYSSGTNFKEYNSRISTAFSYSSKDDGGAFRRKNIPSHGDQFAQLVIRLYSSLS